MTESKEIRIPVPWGHVAAKSYGSPANNDNVPVLLVHGLLDNAGCFDRLISRLPGDHHYVAMDLPGHGLSSHFAKGLPLNFFNYVLSLWYVVEELNWTKFHLVGHSFGAQLSLFYSLMYPGRVQRLTVIEGFYPRIVPEPKMLPWIRKTLKAATEDSRVDTPAYSRDEVMYTLRCKRKFALNSPAAEAMFQRSVTEVSPGSYRYNRDPRLKNYVLPMLSLDQLMCLIDNVDAKALILFSRGTADMFPREAVRASGNLVESLVDAKLVFVEGNHDVHNNHPERIAPYITKFLSDCSLTSKL